MSTVPGVVALSGYVLQSGFFEPVVRALQIFARGSYAFQIETRR